MRTSCCVDEPLRATGSVERMRLAALMVAIACANCRGDQTIVAGRQSGGGAFHWSEPKLPDRDAALLDALVAGAGLEVADARTQAEITVTAICERSATLKAADLRWAGEIHAFLERERVRIADAGQRAPLAAQRYPIPSPYDLPTQQTIDGRDLLRAIGAIP